MRVNGINLLAFAQTNLKRDFVEGPHHAQSARGQFDFYAQAGWVGSAPFHTNLQHGVRIPPFVPEDLNRLISQCQDQITVTIPIHISPEHGSNGAVDGS